MGKVIELSDEQYRAIERAAEARGQTPDALIASVIAELAAQNGAEFYETDDWFRHLGATDEQIAVAEQIALTRSSGLSADT